MSQDVAADYTNDMSKKVEVSTTKIQVFAPPAPVTLQPGEETMFAGKGFRNEGDEPVTLSFVDGEIQVARNK